MPGRAKSQAAKSLEGLKLVEKYRRLAVDAYNEEQASNKPGPKRGLSSFCKEFELLCLHETKHKIILHKSTVARWVNHTSRPIREFNKTKQLLTNREEISIVDYAIDLARRGFPFSHDRVREHINEILEAHHGAQFSGIGKRWLSHFLTRHSDRLQAVWSHALDHSRARAVNPTTHHMFFDILEATIKGEGDSDVIPGELIYGADETGLMLGVALRERVIAPAGRKIQQLRRSGKRENVTVLVTICADGTSLPPAVIFKGEGYQMSWKQNNPLNASLGYSRKGYMTGELGVKGMKNFEKATRLKANGRRRLLLVDGHQTHCTRGFLETARKNHVEVICYPSHSTHIYQGLDVVIFSVLKRAWTRIWDDFEKHGGHVDKTNFLNVYSQAHIRALTEDNIHAAFHATGVYPVNRNFITPNMMDPSIETSLQRTIPGKQTDDVQALTNVLKNNLYNVNSQSSEAPSTAASQVPSQTTQQPPSPTNSIIEALKPTQGAYLVQPGTVLPTNHPPIFSPYLISPRHDRYYDLLSKEPCTEQERKLRQALHESEARDAARKEQVLEMQATSVLQNIYVRGVQAELQAAADYKKKRVGKKVRLNGDGKPKLLTGDEFMELANQKEEEDRELEMAAEHQSNMRYEYHMARNEWEMEECARKERNQRKRAKHQEAMEKWLKQPRFEGRLAPQQQRKPAKKPFERPAPPPKLVDFLREDVEGRVDDESEESSDSEVDDE